MEDLLVGSTLLRSRSINPIAQPPTSFPSFYSSFYSFTHIFTHVVFSSLYFFIAGNLPKRDRVIHAVQRPFSPVQSITATFLPLSESLISAEHVRCDATSASMISSLGQ